MSIANLKPKPAQQQRKSSAFDEMVNQAIANNSSDPVFDAVLEVDRQKPTPADSPISKAEEQALLQEHAGLVNLTADEQRPHPLIGYEGSEISNLLEKRLSEFQKVLEKMGMPNYAAQVRSLMVTLENIEDSANGQGILLQKLLTYADKAMDLIQALDIAEMLVGNPDSKSEKDKGLIGLAIEDLLYENLQRAQLAIAGFQKDKSVNKDGVAVGLGLAPSSVSIKDSDIEAWISGNVEGYKELRYEYNMIATVTRTLKRFLWQINRVAQSNEKLISVYPSRFDISDLKKYFEAKLRELQDLISQPS
jgi:hypothetical protein